MNGPILPGATIGVFGSGQLGRMLALAARSMGYRVAVYSDDRSGQATPAGQLAESDVHAAYDNPIMLPLFARGIDVATTEFENVPAQTLAAMDAAGIPTRPGAAVVEIAQHRSREKRAFAAAGLPTVRWTTSPAEIIYPALAKTATLGYDGKGQWPLDGPEALADLWTRLPDGTELIYEERVPLVAECSVLVARGPDGETAIYPAIENHHRDGILDWSVAPARLPAHVTDAAQAAACRLAEHLDLVGLACLECFVVDDGGLSLRANELAPRPHNSGHLTIEASETSQFHQQLRAICGLPLGGTALHRPAAMVNLLGDLWAGGEPDWAAALSVPGTSLHLYGKAEARPGRKMGHLTVTAEDPSQAVERALAARRRLVEPQEPQPA
jgi:5-(carboxyamino)imidazole ribonucleotide synthase